MTVVLNRFGGNPWWRLPLDVSSLPMKFTKPPLIVTVVVSMIVSPRLTFTVPTF